ncbi:MAG: hypothetical protein LBJ73_01075 [Rickettsiales bacterium]|jgi:hypothetical protein|nr:hypothetical protein [Rickettsiales bacterium]
MRIATAFLFYSFFIGACPAAHDVQVQMLAARLESLQSERDHKAAELRDCEKNVKGFKVAGIATLSATGIGIGINVALASKLAATKSGGSNGARGGAAADMRSSEQVSQDNADLFAELGI